jgi:HPt (histidine-containing phosphotransfer) domain-containing protein
MTPSLSRPVFWSKAEALDRLGGDEDLLRELCGIFLEESPKLMQKLRQAVADGDAEAAMQAAHSLKGEVSYLGAGGASRAARQLEDMGREKNLSQASEALAELERELAGLHFAMKDPAGVLQ